MVCWEVCQVDGFVKVLKVAELILRIVVEVGLIFFGVYMMGFM